MKDICQNRFEAFGSAGHASKIIIKSLETMQGLYAIGTLNQKIK
jgi:fructose-bisphosphate aldolase class II